MCSRTCVELIEDLSDPVQNSEQYSILTSKLLRLLEDVGEVRFHGTENKLQLSVDIGKFQRRMFVYTGHYVEAVVVGGGANGIQRTGFESAPSFFSVLNATPQERSVASRKFGN